jgi:hypothetical protein
MIVKIHKTEGRTVVAVCDDDLLGQRIEEGDLQLDLSSDFYRGTSYSDKVLVRDIMRNADVLNVAGKVAVALALEEGLIDKTHIITIKGVPHAQASVEHE